MHKNNEFYVCRVCGAEQPEAPWGDDGETPTYDICNWALLNKSNFC